MKYLLLIYRDESKFANATPEESSQMLANYMAFTKEVKQAGIHLASEPLHPAPTAQSVRVREGDIVRTDGPFAETKEQLGGFYLLDCQDMDEAVAYAAKIPGAKYGTIEVREVLALGG